MIFIIFSKKPYNLCNKSVMEMKRNRTVFFSSPITQRIWELIPSEEFQSKENSWKLERNQIQNQNLQKIDNFYVDLAKKHIDGVGFIFFVSLCSLDYGEIIWRNYMETPLANHWKLFFRILTGKKHLQIKLQHLWKVWVQTFG